MTSSNETLSRPFSSISRADDVERRPRVAASRAAVVAEMADVGRGVLVRRAAADAPLRVGRVLQRRARHGAGRRAPKTTEPGRSVAISPSCGSSPFATSTASGGRSRASCAPAPGQRARARRSGRAGRETGFRARPRAARGGSPPRAARPRPPRTGPARRPGRRAAPKPRPETRFAPARLCASRTEGSRIRAAIAAVVVLPFVAETSADPRGSRAARRSTALGSSFQSSLPGSVVPPPAPASRERPAAARARPISRASGPRTPPRYRADLGRHPLEGTFGSLTLPGDVAGPPAHLGSARISRRATKATPC